MRTYTSYAWGGLYCPTGECEINPIYKTPSGAETFAKQAHKKIKRCPHRNEDQTAAVGDATDHLDAADRFADAADRLIERDEHRERAEELVALSASAVDAAQVEVQFEAAYDRAQVLDWEGATLLEGTTLDGETEAPPVVAEAEREVALAEDSLDMVSHVRVEHAALIDRFARVQERVEGLKVELGIDGAEA